MKIQGAWLSEVGWIKGVFRFVLVMFFMMQWTAWSAVTTLVPLGSTWGYLDDGSDQGMSWTSPNFDDSAWATGPAQLGYGDGDEATTVSSGPDANNKYVTTYFRHAFSVLDAANYSTLTLRLLRDDGAVVYLNGVEVFRSNMPGGTITSTTYAAGTVSGGDENSFYTGNLDPSLLIEGVNVLAVEVHQVNATSSDISFDLELEGFRDTIQVTLNAPADGSINLSQQPTLDVSVSHLDGQPMTVTFNGRATPPVGQDFTLIALPDTQYYVSSLNGGLPEMFVAQTEWILDNIKNRNIVFTTELGDCVEHGDTYESEWLNAIDALYRLENPLRTGFDDGLPYGVAVGNHDQSPGGDPNGSTFYYNQYFGVDHFNGRIYYGGHYGDNNDNHWEIFSAGGLDFMIVHLEYDGAANPAVLAWANNLLQANPNRQAIVVSHYLVETGNPAAFGFQGQAIYDALKGNPNLFLMLSGHVRGEGRRTDTFNGNTIHTVMADYQGRAGGGNGWLRIMEFSPADSLIRVHTYSPWLDQVEVDADSDFELYYDMQSLLGAPFATIAINPNVTSGSSTTALWDNLAPGTEYEWFVSVSDGTETVTSPAWRFTTADGPPEAPTGLTATAGDSQVALNWNASPGANSYHVQRSTTSGVPYEETIATGVANNSYTDTTAVNDTTYFYVVSAVNGSGTSPNSNEASATPQFNNPPVAADDAYSVDEDQPLSVAAPGVLANDTDLDGHSLVALLVTDVSNGALALNADGSFSYMPNADFYGSDSFTYQASDGGKASNLATVGLTVNAVNDAPLAQDDVATTLRDIAVTIDVLVNDADVENDPLTVIDATDGTDGTVVVNPDSTLRYIPDAGFEGQDSFIYTVSDGAATAQATVTVDVQKLVLFADDFESGDFVAGGWVLVSGPSSVDVNSAFNGNYGALLKKNASMAKELSGLTATQVEISYWRATDKLSGNEALHVETSEDGQNWIDLEAVTGTTPWEFLSWIIDMTGPDLFVRFRLDGNAGNDAAMIDDVEIAVVAALTVPTANDDAYSVDEDGFLSPVAPGVLGNDTDPEGDFLMATLVSGVTQGVLSLNADGSFSYTPNADYFGTDSFTYAATDGNSQSAAATVVITVNAINDVPVTNGDAYNLDENTTLDVPAPGVLGNDSDADGDTLTATVQTGPANGSLTFHPDGSFTYDPNIDYIGPDSFTYVVDDGSAQSLEATVTLTINEFNEAPVALDDAFAVDEDNLLTVGALAGVLSNDTDAEDDPLEAVLVSDVGNGSLSLNQDGSFIYTPNADFHGDDSFTYVANDGLHVSDSATVVISVSSINDDPVANMDSYSLSQDTELNVVAPGVLENDSDVDGDPLMASLITGPVNGSLSFNADGSFIYTPNLGYLGSDSFTYEIADGQGGVNTAQVNLTVMVSPSGAHIADLESVSINEGATWTAVVTITVHDGSHALLANATVSGTWSGGGIGSAIATTDGTGQCTVTISGIPKREPSVTFTVDNLTHDTLYYDVGSNHDQNGNTNGSVIEVGKP